MKSAAEANRQRSASSTILALYAMPMYGTFHRAGLACARGGRMVHASTSSPAPLELEMDLASLASQSAIELDDLLIGRPTELTAVRVLAEKIEASLPSGQTMDATTAVAVQHALIETPGLPHGTTVSELLSSAADLTARFSKLAGKQNPAENAEEVKQLRSFCVALSRISTALQRSPYDR